MFTFGPSHSTITRDSIRGKIAKHGGLVSSQSHSLDSTANTGIVVSPTIGRTLKTRGKDFLRSLFELGQGRGFDLLPRHFYSEIPNIRQLKQDTSWRAPYNMLGIEGDIEQQLAFLGQCVGCFSPELAKLNVHKTAVKMNGSDEGYGEIEAQFLYCFVCEHRPPTIVQIGCGVSTAVCLLAAKHAAYSPRIVCIEPYPTQFLIESQRSGAVELIASKAQDVNLSFFARLSAGDLFFVDSSHTLGPSGEVSRIILGILPTIAPGTFVHFHDIWFPYDYSPHILSSDLFFAHETPLLYAFLCMNKQYRIEACLNQLFHERKYELQMYFPSMKPAEFIDGLMTKPGHHPSSIILRS